MCRRRFARWCAPAPRRSRPDACSRDFEPPAPSSARCASITAIASARRRWTGSTASSSIRGDLAFDIGAHVGDRVASFRRLGARVVAVEPQPALVRILRLFYGRKRNVVIESVLVGSSIGRADLRINVDNPTISTVSAAFVDAADGAPGWEGQRWTRMIRMPVTTLDTLIARHGTPAFIKIDVEGFEADVLAGLTKPVKALVVRIHHHPARCRASLHRALRRARLFDIQRRSRRVADADRRNMDVRAGDPPLGRCAAA